MFNFCMMSIPNKVDATANGKEYKSFDGRKYYYNKITEQSKWRIPDDVKIKNVVQKCTIPTRKKATMKKSYSAY
ncbi:pre-mRNA-processing protein 40A-like protein isoform X1, partial [Tanacetum coccineum]